MPRKSKKPVRKQTHSRPVQKHKRTQDWRAGPFRSSSLRGEPQIRGVSEAMSAIRVLRTRRENTASCAKTRPFETDHSISSLVSVFATRSRAVLRLPTQLLPVGKGFRQQPPRRCQESILPGNAFPPVVGDGVQAVEGAGELPRHCCYRIGVVGQVGREQHRAAEVSGAGD